MIIDLNKPVLHCGLILFAILSTVYSQAWINSGPYGGYVTALYLDTVDSETLYAGTYGAGVYKSTDSGISWTNIAFNLPERDSSYIHDFNASGWGIGRYYPISLIKSNISDSNTIIIGTIGCGLYKLNDLDNGWLSINTGLPDSGVVSQLWINPDDNQVMYCGLDQPNSGLYRSLTGGDQWTLVDSSFAGPILDIFSLPSNNNTMFVSTRSSGIPGALNGVYKSVDGGFTWEAREQCSNCFNHLINPENELEWWRIWINAWGDWNCYRSEDEGTTWSVYPSIDTWNWIINIFADNLFNLYVTQMDWSKNSPIIRRKMHNQDDWQILLEDYPSPPVSIKSWYGANIAANQTNPNKIYFGTEAGVYKSENYGDSALLVNEGMINSYVLDVAVHPIDTSVVFAGGHNGLWRSIDGGNAWERISKTNVYYIAINTDYPDTIFCAGNSIIRSIDGGDSWETVYYNGDMLTTSLAILPDSSNIILFGKYPSTIYRSDDFGDSWSVVFTGGPSSFSIKSIIGQDNGTVYFGSEDNLNDHGFYRSTDWGNSWIKIADPGRVNSIALDGNDPNIIYICSQGSIYKSVNGGDDFSRLITNIDDSYISKIYHLNYDYVGLLVIGENGIHYTVDSDQHFYRLDNNIYWQVTDIDLFPQLDKIAVATHGNGVWIGNNVNLGNLSKHTNYIPKSFVLHRSYPNPFNNFVIVPITVNKPDVIMISIINIKGELVNRMIDRLYYSSGKHHVIWDGLDSMGKSCPSGMYFVQIMSNSMTVTEKMLYIK